MHAAIKVAIIALVVVMLALAAFTRGKLNFLLPAKAA